MKKELFITAGLCIIIFFQITMLNGEETWLRTYDPFYESIFEVNNLVISSDGGYAINGTAMDPEEPWPCGFVIKTDSDGHLLWAELDILASYFSEARTLIETDDGGIISVTHNYSSFVSSLSKHDADGNREWIYHINNLGIFSLDRTNDGNIIAGGYLNQWPALVKFNQNGNIIWSEIYPFNDYNGGAIGSVIQASDGGYLLAGHLRENIDNNTMYRYLIIKTDFAGNLLWSRIYDNYQTSINRFALIETLEGDIIAGGSLYVSSSIYNFGFLWKLDSEGNTIWQDMGLESCGRYFSSFARTSEGMIIALYYDPDMGPSIRKFDPDYNIFWTNELPNHSGIRDKALRVTDSDYILVALLSGLQIGLIKLNPEGMDVDDEVIISPDRVLKAYPNPFNPTVNFSYLLENPGIVNIQIFNIKGQLIDDLDPGIQPVGRHHLPWQANNLGSGVFFVILKLNNEILDTQKIMLLK